MFLNDAEAVEREIAYVDDNPVKEGKPRQRWSFVTPFNVTIALATARDRKNASAMKERVARDAAK